MNWLDIGAINLCRARPEIFLHWRFRQFVGVVVGINIIIVICRPPEIAVFIVCEGVQQSDVLRADGQRQTILNGMEVYEVAENMALQRQNENVAAAFEPFEKVGAAKTFQASARPRQIGQRPGLLRSRRFMGRGSLVIAQTIARQRSDR